MSVSSTSIKRKQDLPPQNKRKSLKITNKHPSTFTPAFWEGQSRVWLTRRALRELDRRNRLKKTLNHPSKSPLHSPPFSIVNHKNLEDINHIAKTGGFDLTDLRGYHEPMEHGLTNNDPALVTRFSSTTITRTNNSGPHDGNFEQKLSDAGVFYPRNLPPSAGTIPSPENLEQLHQIALRRRPSLSHERFTDADYLAYLRNLETKRTEAGIMEKIIPIIEGTNQGRGVRCINKPFNNFSALAAGIVCGTPDLCYGSNPAEVESEVQMKLNKSIFPSTIKDMLVAPNFFLEVKGALGSLMLADRQALHTGALGERGQITLRAWRRVGSGLDKKTHTITATFYNGFIEIYSIHAEESRIENKRTDYYMKKIFSYSTQNGAESFRTAVSAYRNMRDFAEEQRRLSIDMANSMIRRTVDAEA